MDNLQAIRYLAEAEARNHAPLRVPPENSEVDGSPHLPWTIPQLLISRSSSGSSSSGSKKYTARIVGHVGHDNEGRAPHIAHFLESMVLPYVHEDVDVSGRYPIELHDSYSYLPRSSEGQHREKYRGALTFSKPLTDRHTIALPDPYQMFSYGGMLAAQDPLAFEQKQDVVLFAGTTTGDRDPAKNERVAACLWSLGKPDFKFYLTNIAQMTIRDLQKSIPDQQRLGAILRAPVSREEHFRARYILNVQGNTCCWSRVPMVLSSNSVMLNLAHQDGTWYYPLLQAGTHYVPVASLDALPDVLKTCRGSPGYCKMIAANGNRFVQQYCGQVHAAYYTRCLLEAMASNR
jgi:hypothetical protein